MPAASDVLHVLQSQSPVCRTTSTREPRADLCATHGPSTQAPYTFTAADYSALAEGVGTLAAAGWATSTQFVFGSGQAIALSPSNNAALVSAAGYGPGRLLFFGSPSYFGACTGTAGICRLLANAARWAAPGKAGGIRLAAAGTGSAAWTTSGAIASLVSQVGCWERAGGQAPGRRFGVQTVCSTEGF